MSHVCSQGVCDLLCRLSLKVQKDGLTLATALQTIECAQLTLISLETDPGERLQQFLAEVQGETFRDIPLPGVSDQTLQNFHRFRLTTFMV